MYNEENQTLQPKNPAAEVLSCVTRHKLNPYLYLALAGLLLLNMIWVLLPFLKVSVWGFSESFTLFGAGFIGIVSVLTILLNLLAIAVMAIPFAKPWLLGMRDKMSESVRKYLDLVLGFFEQRLFLVAPAGCVAALEVLMFLFVVLVKNLALGSVGGGMAALLSVSVGITFAGWMMLLCSLGAVAIAGLMILEILGKKIF